MSMMMLLWLPGILLAYIGPGVGAGAFATVIAVAGAVLLAIFAIVYYPIKRMIKGRRKGQEVKPSDGVE